MVSQPGRVRAFQCISEAGSVFNGQYWTFVLICFVGGFIAGVIPLILQGPMFAGMCLCGLQAMRGQQVGFDSLFRGFDYFLESFLVVLLQAVLGVAVMAPVIITAVVLIGASALVGVAAGEQAAVPVMMILIVVVVGIVAAIINIIVSLLFFFAIPLVVDQKMKALDAVKASAAAAWRNMFSLFGLTILLGLLTTVATLACCIPFFLVMPIVLGSVIVAYRSAFPDAKPPVMAEATF